MATYTYVDPITIERDAVRLLIRDTDVSDSGAHAFFSDEELDALISYQVGTGEGRKFCVAADALSIIVSKMTTGREEIGVQRKKVSRLEIEWGVDHDTLDTIQAQISAWRKKCAYRYASSSKVFRVMPAGSRVVDFPGTTE